MSTETSTFFASPPPGVALEIAASHVTALTLSRSGREYVISAYAVEPLTPGVVTPTLNGPNVHDQTSLASTITQALQKVSSRARRVALVLPDTVAKVSLIRFEKVPAKAQDLDQLVRWQVRKAAPFRIEDAQVSWIPGTPLDGGGREFVVTLARRDVIESFERACDAAGVHAGLIDIATFGAINAQMAATAAAPASGDWLLVHLATDYVTIAVIRGQHLVFFRNRPLGAEADLTDLVHQTAMYHEDRLGGGGFARVVLSGVSMTGVEQAERLRRAIEERVGGKVELLDVRTAAPMRDRISANPGLLDALAAPAGMLLREHLNASGAGRVA